MDRAHDVVGKWVDEISTPITRKDKIILPVLILRDRRAYGLPCNRSGD